MKTPKSWADITIGNLSSYMKVSKEKKEMLQNEVTYITQKVAAILGVTIEEARKIPIEDTNKITKVMASKLPSRLQLSFKLKGQRYNAIIDARKLNGEKYSAIKLIQSRGSDENLHHLLFLISEPRKFGIRKKFPFIGWKTIEFKPEELEERINDFKQLSVDIGWPMASFFLRVSKELRDHLKDFSLNQLEELIQKGRNLQADLEKDMDS